MSENQEVDKSWGFLREVSSIYKSRFQKSTSESQEKSRTNVRNQTLLPPGKKQCPKCQSRIDANAEKCVECQEFVATDILAKLGFRRKTLWDWLSLAVVPLVLIIATILFNRCQEVQREEIERQRQQAAALEAYLDDMTTILSGSVEQKLPLIKARTQAVLVGEINDEQRVRVIRFLQDFGLWESINEDIELTELLTKEDLPKADADLRGFNLTGTDLRNATLSEADLDGAILSSADLSGANLISATLIGAELISANLTGADLSGAKLTGVDLSDADLTGADLTGADLTGANLTGAALHEAELNATTKIDPKWRLVWEIVNNGVESKPVLKGQDLSGANLTGAELTRPRVFRDNIKFLGLQPPITATLSDANLRSADLTGADLTGADLSGATLTGADLSGADLAQVNLSRADLISATLSNAKLNGTSLITANLSDANLSQANLRGADLSGADLTQANLSEAELDDSTIIADKWRHVWEIVNNAVEATPVLIGQDLSGANLSGANLSGANLRRADLQGADLTGADLTGADLTNFKLPRPWVMRSIIFARVPHPIITVLSDASLRGANLQGADLSGADLTCAGLS